MTKRVRIDGGSDTAAVCDISGLTHALDSCTFSTDCQGRHHRKVRHPIRRLVAAVLHPYEDVQERSLPLLSSHPFLSASLRKGIRKIEVSQHSRYTCSFCGRNSVKVSLVLHSYSSISDSRLILDFLSPPANQRRHLGVQGMQEGDCRGSLHCQHERGCDCAKVSRI